MESEWVWETEDLGLSAVSQLTESQHLLWLGFLIHKIRIILWLPQRKALKKGWNSTLIDLWSEVFIEEPSSKVGWHWEREQRQENGGWSRRRTLCLKALGPGVRHPNEGEEAWIVHLQHVATDGYRAEEGGDSDNPETSSTDNWEENFTV